MSTGQVLTTTSAGVTSWQTMNVPTTSILLNTNVNITNNGTNRKLTNLAYNDKTSIKSTNILPNINTVGSFGQQYTFGPKQEEIFVTCHTGGTIHYGKEPLNWNPITQQQGIDATCIAYGAGKFVIGRSNGTIIYSYDGIVWINSINTTFGGNSINCIFWNGSIFVVGGAGTLNTGYSYDGLYWISGSGTTANDSMIRICWDGVKFHMTTSFGFYSSYYSTDGISWIGESTPSFFTCITWNGKIYVAGGTDMKIYYSYDYITWGFYVSSFIFDSIEWNGRIFVIVANSTYNIYGYSYDGINWPSFPSISAGANRRIYWTGEEFLLTSSTNILRSPDGVTFNNTSNIILNSNIRGICSNNNRLHSITISKQILVSARNGTGNLAYSLNGGSTWTASTPTNFFANGFAVCFNGKLWLAGGSINTHTMAFSYDGINWKGITMSPFTTQCLGIAWGDDRWVAVGSGTNTIAYSYDGFTWIGLGAIFSTQGNRVAYNGKQWLAAGQGASALYYSSNGISWTGTITAFVYCNDVIWTGINWVATGFSGGSFGYSYNGINWTAWSGSTIFTNLGLSLAFNGSVVVAGGRSNGNIHTLAYSLDNGITWIGNGRTIFHPDSSGAYGVCWDGTKFVAVGDSSSNGYSTGISYDGISWFPITNSTFSVGYDIFSSSSLTNGPLFGVKIKHPILGFGNGTNNMAISVDGGIRWKGFGTTSCIFTTVGFGGVWNGTLWVAVGQGTNTMAYSYDGYKWYGLGTSVFLNNGNAICWSGTKFVALGQGTNSIVYSSDGISWTGVTGKSIFSGSGYGVCWSGTRFVAVGSGTNTIAYSTDGISWTGIGTSIFSTTGRSIIFAGLRFVAVGIGTNSIAHSSDGISWTGQGNTVMTDAYTVSYNGFRFIVGGLSTIAHSFTGTSFTSVGGIPQGVAYGIYWTGERFISCGQTTNTFIHSFDGLTWFAMGSSTFSAFCYGIAVNNELGIVPIPSQLNLDSTTLYNSTLASTAELDICSDTYMNSFDNCSITIKSGTYTS